MKPSLDSRKWIQSLIKQFIKTSQENTLGNEANEKAWDEPLVGFSNGADPLYLFYTKDIGEFYKLPLDFFSNSFPKSKVDANQLTVISWILPHTELTKEEHRMHSVWPTERWARARIFGEIVNDKLRRYVVNRIQEEGYLAVAPVLSPLFRRHLSEKYWKASSWSERHTAYVAGLGTFGLCDGLITPKGKAMRCGSVIANIDINPSKRPYNYHHEYCLFYTKGTCKECIDRCPVKAISEAGHDKKECSKHVNLTKEYVEKHFGFKGYGCGFCQTGVACESKIPD